MGRQRDGGKAAKGFMSRLGQDTRGNTLAIMAASMVPVIGFAGSAIDVARLYVVRVRLQQACDAGVLAGRKAMTDNSSKTPLDPAALDQANTFFANNFYAKYDSAAKKFTGSWYGTNTVSFVPTKAVNTTGVTDTNASDQTIANAVTGAASATLPMTLMKFFGVQPATINVTCQAVYDLADTDVMFVLDTTGSMSCYPSDPADCANGPVFPYKREDGSQGYAQTEKPATTIKGKPAYSKIESLRQAVLLFDTTMRTNADPSTHFRYGFVTYTSGVNVGYSIPSQYLQQNWTYDSRRVLSDYNYGDPFSQSINVQASLCPNNGTVRMPATGYVRSYDGLWSDEGYPQARVYTNIKYQNGACSGTGQRVRPLWRYEPVSIDTSKLVTGATVPNPTRLDGSTIKWRGCIEELNTTTGSSFDVNNLPDDLNPDIKPADVANKWRPMLPDVTWLRSATPQDIKDESFSEDYGNSMYWALRYPYDYGYGSTHFLDSFPAVTCGKAAQTVGVMTADDVKNYVYGADFKPAGSTYHDFGMIWGTRMLSPDGVFGSTTAAWPGRKQPSRNIVFMTDGYMAPNSTSLGMYGVEALQNRTGGAGNGNTDKANHIARFRVECDAAKKKGITVYVVAVGIAVDDDLTYCASPGQTFSASSTDELTNAFKTIAQRVAMLRISQ